MLLDLQLFMIIMYITMLVCMLACMLHLYVNYIILCHHLMTSPYVMQSYMTFQSEG